MKKLLILFAFVLLISWIGQSKAESTQPSEEWTTCAHSAMLEEHARAEADSGYLRQELCAFYDLKQPDCDETWENSTPKQQAQALALYLTHRVIHPKCGIPE